MYKKEGGMGNPKKTKPRPTTCLICDKMTHDLAICGGCRKSLGACGRNPAVFCKRCQTLRGLASTDARELCQNAQPRDAAKLVIIIYDPDFGCPACAAQQFAQPHGLVYRTTMPEKGAS